MAINDQRDKVLNRLKDWTLSGKLVWKPGIVHNYQNYTSSYRGWGLQVLATRVSPHLYIWTKKEIFELPVYMAAILLDAIREARGDAKKEQIEAFFEAVLGEE